MRQAQRLLLPQRIRAGESRTNQTGRNIRKTFKETGCTRYEHFPGADQLPAGPYA